MWRKGFGNCEVWALLGFVEAPLPLLVSITRPGPLRPAMWNQIPPEEASQHFLQLDRLQQRVWSWTAASQ